MTVTVSLPATEVIGIDSMASVNTVAGLNGGQVQRVETACSGQVGEPIRLVREHSVDLDHGQPCPVRVKASRALRASPEVKPSGTT